MSSVVDAVNEGMQRTGGPNARYAPWGPWSPAVTDDPAEIKAQLRAIATLVHVIRPPNAPDPGPLVRALAEAEPVIREGYDLEGYDLEVVQPPNPAMDRARQLFDLLPALVQRRIICTMAAVAKEAKGDIKLKT